MGAKHPVAQSEADWKKIENHHEAIISEEMFDTVQKKRAGNRNHSQMSELHCLKGKIICGNCRHKMTHFNVGRPKYECRQHYVNPSITGCVKSVRDEDIEAIVIQELQVQLDAMLDTEKVQQRQKQLQSEKLYEAEKKLRTMPAGFAIKESRIKVVELNREIVEIFVDRIVVHEGGD